MRSLFSFPNPVNESSARLVAAGVVAQSILYLLTRQWWLLIPLAYGFVARVLTGPTLSPLGQFVTRVATARLAARGILSEQRQVPGPPKRFAQGIGAVLSVGALVSAAADTGAAPVLAFVLVAGITVAATLESAFGYCLGCTIFGLLMRSGLIPDDVCESCNDISARLAAASAHQTASALAAASAHQTSATI